MPSAPASVAIMMEPFSPLNSLKCSTSAARVSALREPVIRSVPAWRLIQSAWMRLEDMKIASMFLKDAERGDPNTSESMRVHPLQLGPYETALADALRLIDAAS